MLTPLLSPMRWKVLQGGRGSGKSVAAADGLLIQSLSDKHRVLCTREYQVSIRESVHRLLQERIFENGMNDQFDIQQKTIFSRKTGSDFIFKGLKHNTLEIKGLQGITRAWVEEAQGTSDESWEILIPTIRAPGSEIWVTFNAYLESDPTYQRLIVQKRPDAWVQKVDWQDNPWFPAELEVERRYLLSRDLDAYAHVWGGECLKLSDAAIFRKRISVEGFDEPHPDTTRFFYGADWGFAADPTCIVRMFIADETLFITHEAWAIGCELDDTPALFDSVPGARDWPIKADNSRPETISYIRRQGFNITAADKWAGSVEDGVEHLKAFRRIVIHDRCRHAIEEFRLYSYKTDRVTREIIPQIQDANNHVPDAVRYGLADFIQRRGATSIWERL